MDSFFFTRLIMKNALNILLLFFSFFNLHFAFPESSLGDFPFIYRIIQSCLVLGPISFSIVRKSSPMDDSPMLFLNFIVAVLSVMIFYGISLVITFDPTLNNVREAPVYPYIYALLCLPSKLIPSYMIGYEIFDNFKIRTSNSQ